MMGNSKCKHEVTLQVVLDKDADILIMAGCL